MRRFLLSSYLMLLALVLPGSAFAETVAKIGDVEYESLASAVSAAETGQTVSIVAAGTYTVPGISKNITVQGDVNGVTFDCPSVYEGNIASFANGVTFKNVTFNITGNQNYYGFKNSGTINMEGCTLYGKFFSYGDMNFTNCQFVQNAADGDYHMWVYGGNNAVVNYTDCTFTNNVKGKFIHVYSESDKNKVTVNISGCKFINNGSASKAAVNLKSTSNNNPLAYTVNIDAASCSTKGAFPAKESSDASIYYNALIQVDDVKSGVTDANTVTVDNVTIYKAGASVEVVEIATVDDLKAFRDAVNNSTSYAGKIVRLTADLNLSGEANWKPIGDVAVYPGHAFKGTFDGNGKTISNLTVDDQTVNWGCAALFGSVSNGSIINLTVKDVDIKSYHYAGGIVAYKGDGTTVAITNCHVIGGTITSTPEVAGSGYDNGDKVGGIIGYTASGTTITNCTVEGVTLSAYRDLGGIGGYVAGTVTDCTVKNVTLIQDDTNGYKSGDMTATVGEVVGGRSTNAAATNSGNGNTTENVIITHPVAGVAQIGETVYATLQEALDAAENQDIANIVIDLLGDATLDITAWDGTKNPLSIGTVNTETITINGNGYTLTFNHKNSDWNNVATMNDAQTKLILNNMTVTNSGYNNGPWNRHDINFNCDVTLNSVTSEVALAFKNSATLKDVTVSDAGSVYGIWIQPNGQNVSIDGLTVTAERGIKIDDQYVGAPELTNLDIANATFNTTKKSAILVKTAGGAAITVGEGINIENVKADDTNLVWIDEDKADEFYNVTVSGANLIPEGGETSYVASLVRGEQVRGYYATFAAAYTSTDYVDGDSYVLHKNTTEAVEIGKALTIVKNGFTAANLTVADGFQKSESDEAITFASFNPVAQIGEAKYESLEAAIAAAQDGETIVLLEDIDLGTEYLALYKALTIDGDSKYSISSAAAQAVLLTGSGNVTLSNVSVVASKGHGIQAGSDDAAYSGVLNVQNSILTVAKRGIRVYKEDTGFAINVTGSVIQSNVADPTTGYTTGNDAMGLSLGTTDNKGYTVTVTNSEIRGFSYDINSVTSGSNLTVTMTGGKTYGRAVLNVWGNNNIFTLDGVEVNGLNNQTGPTEAFACIVENIGAQNNVYNINGTTFNAVLSDAALNTAGSSATQQMVDLRSTGSTLTITGNTTYTANTADKERVGLVYNKSALETNIITLDGTANDALADQIADLVAEGVTDTEDSGVYTLGYVSEVYYYWIASGAEDGGNYDFAEPFKRNWLDNDEFIRLKKNVTLSENLTWAKENASFTLTLGEYNVTKGEYSVALKNGVTVNTDKQTDIFTASDASYTVKETAVEGGYNYAVVERIFVAQIGEAKYESLEAAIAAAQDGETVALLSDCSGNGVKVPQGKYTAGLTVDFAGFTYTVDGSTVGSTGTQTNGFQLLKGNTITFKNGTITSTKAKILVQNYSNLTLEGMTLTLDNGSYTSAYTLSNNNANVFIDNTTISANPAGGFAFDVCRYASYPSVNVTVQNGSTINGNVEIYASSSNASDGFCLTLTSGTLNGDIVVDATAAAAMEATPEKATVIKDNAFTLDAPEGYEWEDNGDGTSTLVEKTEFTFTDGTDTYTIAEDKEGVTATYVRTFGSSRVNKYQGWFVPFDYTITAGDLEKFRFFQINMIAHTAKEGETEDASKLWIHLIKMNEGDVLKANKPYIFTPLEETENYEFTTTNATLKAATAESVADCSTLTEKFDFYGVYTSANMASVGGEFYYMTANGQISRATKATTTVGSFRWIFTVTNKDGDKTSVAYSPSFNFVVDSDDSDDLTAVGSATDAAVAEGDAVGYYTLSGNKVEQPGKGVYVVKYANGTSKKVVF